jgi:uncharacterized protein YdaU (DUF1376 family)
MSKLPSMPFFVDAYLGDTMHLSTVEHGAYLLLLFAMWRHNGSVPDDDRDNARVCRMTLEEFQQMKVRLAPFLTTYGSGQNRVLTQDRLQKEWNYTIESAARQSDKGKRGAKSRWQQNQTLNLKSGHHSVSAQAMPRQCVGNGQTMAPIPTKKDITSFLTEPARATSGKEETTPDSQPSPDGAGAPDGAAPPSSPDQDRENKVLNLPDHLNTPFMRKRAS